MDKRWRLRFPVAPITRLRADFEVRKTNGVNGTVAAEETPRVRATPSKSSRSLPHNSYDTAQRIAMAANIEELQRLNQLYRGVVEVSALINSITEFDELLSAILDVAGRVMRAEASSLFLIDPDTRDLQLPIARGPPGH